jgi:hypothetical protein
MEQLKQFQTSTTFSLKESSMKNFARKNIGMASGGMDIPCNDCNSGPTDPLFATSDPNLISTDTSGDIAVDPVIQDHAAGSGTPVVTTQTPDGTTAAMPPGAATKKPGIMMWLLLGVMVYAIAE